MQAYIFYAAFDNWGGWIPQNECLSMNPYTKSPRSSPRLTHSNSPIITAILVNIIICRCWWMPNRNTQLPWEGNLQQHLWLVQLHMSWRVHRKWYQLLGWVISIAHQSISLIRSEWLKTSTTHYRLFSNHKNLANRQIKFWVNTKVLLFSRKGNADHSQVLYAVSFYGTIPEKFVLLDQAKVPLVPSLPSWPFCIVMSRVMVIVATALATCNQAVHLPFFAVWLLSDFRTIPPKRTPDRRLQYWSLALWMMLLLFSFFSLPFKFSRG